RATAISGESVAIEIDNVDINRPQRVALLQNARTLVDQCVDATINNLVSVDLPLQNVGLRSPLFCPRGYFGIRDRNPILIVLVPARTTLLSKAAHFAETVSGEWLSNAGLFQVAIF